MEERKLEVHRIMGKVSIAQPLKRQRHKVSKIVDQAEKKQRINNFKKHFSCVKHKNKMFLARTEKFDIDDITHALMLDNGAVKSHLLAFCSIARYAVSNGYHVGYGEYRKRVKHEDIKKLWQNIRTWLQRHTEDSILAASIGLWSNGYVYVRFIVTSENDVEVHDMSVMIAHYLRKIKGFMPKVLQPYEENPYEFIKDKYANDEVETVEDIFSIMPDEVWQVMRASFILPFTHRTYETTKSKEIRENTKEIDYLDNIQIPIMTDNVIWGGVYKMFTEDVPDGDFDSQSRLAIIGFGLDGTEQEEPEDYEDIEF